MCLLIDRTSGTIVDTRRPATPVLLGAPMSLCYTRSSDDITTGPKPSATPYVDRTDDLIYENGVWYGRDTKTTVTVDQWEDGLIFRAEASADGLSEYGVNLPFNFMGKINGGGWRRQYLFNSPYSSVDNRTHYAYLTNSDGNHLLVVILTSADGWKMDYSPYLWAHYFVNLKLLASFDRAYGTPDREKRLTFALLPVSDFDDALSKMSRLYDRPFLDYNVGGGALGTEISLKAYGDPDMLLLRHEKETRLVPFTTRVPLTELGESELIPIKNGVHGAPVTVYCYDSLWELYRRAILAADPQVVKKYTDGNLCEHQCWCAAALRFLQRSSHSICPLERSLLEDRVREFLSVLTETDVGKAIPRQTIYHLPHDNLPAYNVYRSRRVQELFFGITILIDAYRYFGDERYYRYAVGATDNLITNYQREDGRLEVIWDSDSREDYTTVCCAMIPLVDMIHLTEPLDSERSARYRDAADRMAAYLYHRGMRFPTEGGTTCEAETEMEEGSISCTALALLYYCKNVRRNDAYIDKAKEILDVHESWIIKTPICQMHGSTLRWWETQWEGDADGPAICAGHAWSIWRAEADFLYYKLTGDRAYRQKAENGFLTNLSKIRADGSCTSIYSPDRIPGGGFHRTSDEVRFRVAPRFSDIEDCGISRYVWIRLCDTFLAEK